MLQPFELFKSAYIDRLVALKKFYIVSQAYHRYVEHFSDDQKINLLFSDYDDIGLAKIHLAAVKAEKYAAILDLRNEKHVKKLGEMLGDDSGYRIFWAVVNSINSLKKRIDAKYKDHFRKYILEHTDWRIGVEEKIKPKMQVVFGELFITLKRGSQELRVKFEDVEKV